jgi:hypothetical protein
MRIFSLALVLCAISSAQDTTATVEGRVLDPSGRVITGGGPLQAPLSVLDAGAATQRAHQSHQPVERAEPVLPGFVPAAHHGSDGGKRHAPTLRPELEPRGPGIANVDLSLLKSIPLDERARLQFRAEWFNIANHANFGLPDNDLASPNFGRVLEAGPPRLVQFGLKLVF